MNFISTRNTGLRITSSQAIIQGISAEGGLIVPERLPAAEPAFINGLAQTDYACKAERVLKFFLTDFSDGEVGACVNAAYNSGAFEHNNPAPVVALDDMTFILELWHGPTCAFKDIALQILPRLMALSANKTGLNKDVVILTATSGDTGKAALEGFKDVEGVKIIVFYPQDGVSAMQKLQMQTQEGSNVQVCAVNGNFDDAQNGVKALFTDAGTADRLSSRGMVLSSANSINFGRLAPQIAYYFSAYGDLVAAGRISAGEKINFAVPTGNFGNILAGYYAAMMGLPVHKLICASNANNVLTEFINTGKYSRNRKFFSTISPSMDILISSNLERLLFDVYGKNSGAVSQLADALTRKGEYIVPAGVRSAISERFWGGYCDDTQTKATIKQVFERHAYLCDPHTAVAVRVCGDYRVAAGDGTKTVILSTANPYKFSGSVLSALCGEADGDEFDMMDKLSSLTRVPVPAPLMSLRSSRVRFDRRCEKQGMGSELYDMLGI